MAFPQGIYFRATDDQTDPTNYDAEVSSFSANYPRTSAQGNSVGWEAALNDVRDRGGAGAVELRGIAFVGATAADYRIDLPATGDYNIRGAFGDQSATQTGKVTLVDTSTVFATPLNGEVLAGTFNDATGVNRTSQSDWTTNNAPLSRTFASTIFRTRVGNGAVNSPIAAIYIESAGAAAVFTRILGGGFPGMRLAGPGGLAG